MVAGSRLGRYELLARIATGGMGEIFLARLEGAAGFEKLRGQPIDRRADVFSLGVVVFEMLTCRRLYQRKTDYLTFRAVMERSLPRATSSKSRSALLSIADL